MKKVFAQLLSTTDFSPLLIEYFQIVLFPKYSK